jgi:hypothetical protein
MFSKMAMLNLIDRKTVSYLSTDSSLMRNELRTKHYPIELSNLCTYTFSNACSQK